jgi:hypothetical protein
MQHLSRTGKGQNRTRILPAIVLLLVGVFALAACGAATQPTPATSDDTAPAANEEPADDGAGEPATDSEDNASSAGEETGTLQFRANGEDFIRQGFVTKDGWSMTFDKVYVTLENITAYQADPPYDAHEGGTIQATVTAALDGVHTVDLAAGDENAEPVLIGEQQVVAGRYNALSWEMVPAPADSPASGAVIMLQGTAEKEGETIDFTIKLDQPSTHTCGDYVGDERKGIVQAGDTADIEATFHFDHIFGDAETPLDDSLNTGALGFDPLATLATDGVLEADMAMLKETLSTENYEKLANAHLAHVGEGHCTGAGHAMSSDE